MNVNYIESFPSYSNNVAVVYMTRNEMKQLLQICCVKKLRMLAKFSKLRHTSSLSRLKYGIRLQDT